MMNMKLLEVVPPPYIYHIIGSLHWCQLSPYFFPSSKRNCASTTWTHLNLTKNYIFSMYEIGGIEMENQIRFYIPNNCNGSFFAYNWCEYHNSNIHYIPHDLVTMIRGSLVAQKMIPTWLQYVLSSPIVAHSKILRMTPRQFYPRSRHPMHQIRVKNWTLLRHILLN